MRQLLLLFSVLVLSFPSFSQITDERLIGLEVEIEEIIDTWNLPGLAVAIVEKDSIIYEKGFGYRDLTNKKPVTVETLFPIASNTKSFTASLIGILANDKLLKLSDHPSDYFQGLSFYSEDMTASMRIEDLMAHKSGLAAHNMSLILFPPQNRADLVKRIKHLRPSSSVRTDFTYNNMLYSILGMIVQRCTLTKWEKIIAHRIFEPLEMNSSNTSIAALQSAENYALGYDDDLADRQADFFHYTGWEPGGGINSNVHELSNWLITWLNGGQFKDKQVIPERFVQEALSMKTIISSSVPKKTGSNFFTAYGYGWMLQKYYGHYRAHHQGGARGFNAMTTLFPNHSIGKVVLTNEYGSWTNSIVRDLVSNRMLGLEYQDLNKLYWNAYQKRQNHAATATTPKTNGSPQIHKDEVFEGTYTHLGYGQIEISIIDKQLVAQFPNNRFILEHLDGTTFQLKGIMKEDSDMAYYMSTHDVSPEITFVLDENEEIIGLIMPLEPELDSPILFNIEK